MVDGWYVGFDLTLGDWINLCNWLGHRSADPTLDALASLCVQSINVSSAAATAAISLARSLAPPSDIARMLDVIEANVEDRESHYTDDDLEFDEDDSPNAHASA
jgi:hypothetical protein